MDIIDPEDYKCPCCLTFIYVNYACKYKHNICGNCYMKIKECPICRNAEINKCNIDSENNIARMECKNKNKGCKLDLYCFDDEHEAECLYNPLHCKFCKIDINDVSFESIKAHFSSNCINTFQIMNYPYYNSNKSGETDGRKFIIQSLKPIPSLINIDGQYFVVIIPKISQKKVNFMVFSINDKYKLSNYKIQILSFGNKICEMNIHHKKMFDVSVSLSDIQSNNLLNFTIQNMFLINSKVVEHPKFNNTTIYETNSFSGEPGSAGNWTYDDFTELQNKFANIWQT